MHRSEGPVFLLVLTWLVAAFGSKTREEWKQLVVPYDNMCHLNNLKVARKPLPLPGDLQYIWLDVQKIIDELHIKNHSDPRYQQYHPEQVRENVPDMNIMTCGQAFVGSLDSKRS